MGYPSTPEHRETRRRNAIAAIVTDTCLEYTENTSQRLEEKVIPLEVVTEMLSGILAALAGETDPAALKVIHPEVTPLAYTRITALLDNED